eukprot:COSAG03_NODE_371_length_8520_cov_152.945850_6_plen_48_part_00
MLSASTYAITYASTYARIRVDTASQTRTRVRYVQAAAAACVHSDLRV